MRLLIIISMMFGTAYSQCLAPTSLTVSNISSTGGRLTFTAASGATLYSWNVYTTYPSHTFATQGTTTATSFNFAGLSPSTEYRLQIVTVCGLSVSSPDSVVFTTPASTVTYTPMINAGYQIKYEKVDSGFALPLRDTGLYRNVDRAGLLVYKPGDGIRVYDGSKWAKVSTKTNILAYPLRSDSISPDTSRIYIRQSWQDSALAGISLYNTFLVSTGDILLDTATSEVTVMDNIIFYENGVRDSITSPYSKIIAAAGTGLYRTDYFIIDNTGAADTVRGAESDDVNAEPALPDGAILFAKATTFEDSVITAVNIDPLQETAVPFVRNSSIYTDATTGMAFNNHEKWIEIAPSSSSAGIRGASRFSFSGGTAGAYLNTGSWGGLTLDAGTWDNSKPIYITNRGNRMQGWHGSTNPYTKFYNGTKIVYAAPAGSGSPSQIVGFDGDTLKTYAFSGTTPTLQAVTTAGQSTTDSITLLQSTNRLLNLSTYNIGGPYYNGRIDLRTTQNASYMTILPSSISYRSVFFGGSPQAVSFDPTLYGNSNLYFPTTGNTPRYFSVSVNGNYADTLGNITLSVGSITGLGTGVATLLAATPTGSTSLVGSVSPTLVTPTLGVASGTSLVLGGSLGASAILDAQSTTKAFYKPRMTTAQMNAISSPAAGAEIYNTDEGATFVYSNDWGWESDNLRWRTKYGTEYFNDFLGILPAITGSISDGNLTTFTTGGAVTSLVTPPTNRQGVIELSTSTSATGRAGIATATGSTTQSMILGGGRILYEANVMVPTLSTSGERYQLLSGFTSTNNSVNISNGVMFLYDEGGVTTGSAASANWQVYTAASSSRTFTTTSVAVTAGQWYRLQAIVNAAGTSVGFYIDGTLVRTETATIPSAAIGISNQIFKSVGTTARTAQVDYIYFKQKYTTPK